MVLLLLMHAMALAAAPQTLCVTKNPSNDLCASLLKPPPTRHATVAAALASGPTRGDALLILADGYPSTPTAVSEAQYAAFASIGLKVFVEFPAALPPNSSLAAASPTPVALDAACAIAPARTSAQTISRVVITSNATKLPRLQILGIHGSVAIPVHAPPPPAPCLVWTGSRAVGASVSVTLPTHCKALCARRPGQPPSHVRYDGQICSAGGGILWKNFSVADIRAGINASRCVFTCAASKDFCSRTCGGSGSAACDMIPLLPARLCQTADTAAAGQGAAVFAVAARVAGVDTAVFGLPRNNSEVAVVLFAATADVLVATTSFSNVLRGRYAPVSEWRTLLSFVMAWLGSGLAVGPLVPRVRPAYAKGAKLPPDAELSSIRAAVAHLVDDSGLLYSSLSGTSISALHRVCPVGVQMPGNESTVLRIAI